MSIDQIAPEALKLPARERALLAASPWEDSPAKASAPALKLTRLTFSCSRPSQERISDAITRFAAFAISTVTMQPAEGGWTIADGEAGHREGLALETQLPSSQAGSILRGMAWCLQTAATGRFPLADGRG